MCILQRCGKSSRRLASASKPFAALDTSGATGMRSRVRPTAAEATRLQPVRRKPAQLARNQWIAPRALPLPPVKLWTKAAAHGAYAEHTGACDRDTGSPRSLQAAGRLAR